MDKTFNPEDIEQFVNDHIKSKIEHNELAFAGIYNQSDLALYKNALFEGIVNGIFMAGGSVEGIE